VALQGGRRGGRPVQAEVDPVVDDVDAGQIDVEVLCDVVAGALGDGHDGIGHLDRRLLHPGRGVVAAPKLLALPRSERL
jgi:hypothetical protein